MGVCQKTREGCGCFRGLFGGSRGKLRESPRKIAGKNFPSREMLQILGFHAPGKANLPGTLGRHCLNLLPTFHAGCFLKSTVPAFSSSSEFESLTDPSGPRRARADWAIVTGPLREEGSDRAHTKGSCNRTLLRRVLRRFSTSRCFLEGFLEGAL